jgi:hypothetical protein
MDPAVHNLGLAHFEKGDKSRALPYFERYLEMKAHRSSLSEENSSLAPHRIQCPQQSQGSDQERGRESRQKYIIRPLLSLKRFYFDETGRMVRYQYDKHGSQDESMDYLEFISRVTSHIPGEDKPWSLITV